MTSSDPFVRHGKAGTPVDNAFVLDVHAHLGQARKLRTLRPSIEDLIHAMDLLGVNIAAVSAIPAVMGGVVRYNDSTIDAVKRFPDRIFGYMCVNVAYPHEAERELRRCLDAGLRGIKVHSGQGHAYDHPGYQLVWEFASENDLPVLAHAGGDKDILPLEPNFSRYPNVSWVLAHAGIVAHERASWARVAKDYHNVYIDTCYSQCPRGMVEYFVNEGLEDKTLWATDTAYMSPLLQLGRVLFAKITPEQKAKILGLNARRVLKLQCPPVT